MGEVVEVGEEAVVIMYLYHLVQLVVEAAEEVEVEVVVIISHCHLIQV